MTTSEISINRALIFAFALFLLLTGQAYTQVGFVRLSVRKNEKRDQRTTYQNESGTYRQQQIKKTVSYSIEVQNASAAAFHGLVVKWTVLYDSSRAEAHGNGGSTSWSEGGLKIIDGERSSDLGVGQRLAFETDSVDISSVTTGNATTTQRNQYGGDIRGYCVEVLLDGKVLASEIQPPDTKSRIAQVKAKMEKEKK